MCGGARALRRRLLLDLEIPEEPEGRPLQAVAEIADFLEQLKQRGVIKAYGLAMETPTLWFVRLRAKEPEEPEVGAGE